MALTKQECRIVFMGTPEFACETLKKLVEHNYNVVAVVTVPDKPAGRGRKLSESAVKQFAAASNIPVLQPVKLKDETFIKELTAFKPDLQIVVAFRMLPKVVWSLPKLGTFNLHASLLPQYRGAAPINHAIINGETETGVTTFFIDDKIDTGAIMLQEKVNIKADDDAGSLHNKLMYIGSDLVLKTIDQILSGTVTRIPQGELTKNKQLKEAPKIFKEDCKIDWRMEGKSIHNFIRGLSPYPAAWFSFINNEKEYTVKVFKSQFIPDDSVSEQGMILSDNKTVFKISCKNGWINLEELQVSGKKRMSTTDFLRGFKLENATIIS